MCAGVSDMIRKATYSTDRYASHIGNCERCRKWDKVRRTLRSDPFSSIFRKNTTPAIKDNENHSGSRISLGKLLYLSFVIFCCCSFPFSPHFGSIQCDLSSIFALLTIHLVLHRFISVSIYCWSVLCECVVCECETVVLCAYDLLLIFHVSGSWRW